MSENEIKPGESAAVARLERACMAGGWVAAQIQCDDVRDALRYIDRLTAERDAALAALDRIVSLKMSMFKDPCDMLGECVSIAADAIDAARKGVE